MANMKYDHRKGSLEEHEVFFTDMLREGLGVRGHPGQRQVSEQMTSLTNTNQCDRPAALLHPSSTATLPNLTPLREGGPRNS